RTRHLREAAGSHGSGDVRDCEESVCAAQPSKEMTDMSLRDRLMRLRRTSAQAHADAREIAHFGVDVDDAGVNLRVPEDELRQLKAGTASGPAHLQYVALELLREQGDASTLPNGFMISTHAAARID